jgi:hypothetical protein
VSGESESVQFSSENRTDSDFLAKQSARYLAALAQNTLIPAVNAEAQKAYFSVTRKGP